MTLYKGSVPIAGLNTNKVTTGWNIFDCKWADHKLNDIQWLNATTFSWQAGSVYVTAYNTLVSEYNASTSVEETEGDITFKRTANGYKIATADYESAVLEKYNNDGIAWYYILDTANTRFKLPRTKFGFEGLRTSVADDIDESLPNITGSVSLNTKVTGSEATSALYSPSTSAVGSTSTSSLTGGINLDASRSSSTYQDNAPVQERATQMYLYFYVGEYSQTAIEQTAGLNSEMFNSKVDTSSLSEINPMIESYVDGTSGYNIWANGYCEQWGRLTRSAASDTITLTKTYANTNYNIIAIPYHTTLSTDGRPLLIYSTSTTANSFVINLYTGYIGAYWKTSGYLASGQY